MYTLSTTPRSTKRAKDEFKNLRIPAVLYGQGVNPQSLSVPRTEFIRVLAAAGFSSLIDVSLADGVTVKAVIKAVQPHPLTLDPMHIDLHQVRMDQEMTAEIPLKFVGEPAAVKVLMGTLIKNMDTVTVRCLPGNLPHEIEAHLTQLATFEDAITIGDLTLPTGVLVEGELGAVIAKVAPPLTEDQLKKLEESAIGDVTAVKSDVDEKRAAKEAVAATKEPEAKKDVKK